MTPTTPTSAPGVSVEALKRAMDSAAIPQELRAPLIGFYCNELNAAPLPVGEQQGVSEAMLKAVNKVLTEFGTSSDGLYELYQARKELESFAASRPVADSRQSAYARGFYAAAGWAKRPDMYADIGSPAYIKQMESLLGASTTKAGGAS